MQQKCSVAVYTHAYIDTHIVITKYVWVINYKKCKKYCICLPWNPPGIQPLELLLLLFFFGFSLWRVLGFLLYISLCNAKMVVKVVSRRKHFIVLYCVCEWMCVVVNILPLLQMLSCVRVCVCAVSVWFITIGLYRFLVLPLTLLPMLEGIVYCCNDLPQNTDKL